MILLTSVLVYVFSFSSSFFFGLHGAGSFRSLIHASPEVGPRVPGGLHSELFGFPSVSGPLLVQLAGVNLGAVNSR